MRIGAEDQPGAHLSHGHHLYSHWFPHAPQSPAYRVVNGAPSRWASSKSRLAICRRWSASCAAQAASKSPAAIGPNLGWLCATDQSTATGAVSTERSQAMLAARSRELVKHVAQLAIVIAARACPAFRIDWRPRRSWISERRSHALPKVLPLLVREMPRDLEDRPCARRRLEASFIGRHFANRGTNRGRKRLKAADESFGIHGTDFTAEEIASQPGITIQTTPTTRPRLTTFATNLLFR